MTSKQLLYPRFEVIGDWPDSPGGIVGTVITVDKESKYDQYGYDIHGGTWGMIMLKKYPHLFKSLQWFENRNINDMPRFVKTHHGNKLEVQKWEDNYAIMKRRISHFAGVLTPITLEEYLAR